MQSTEANSAAPADQGLERIEQQVRCSACDKFLTKAIVEVFFNPAELARLAVKTVAELFSRLDLQVKVATETKCNRCKEMDTQIVYTA